MNNPDHMLLPRDGDEHEFQGLAFRVAPGELLAVLTIAFQRLDATGRQALSDVVQEIVERQP